MVPQTVLSGADVALGTSAMVFMQTISGTVFLSVGGNVFQDRLRAELAARVPDVDPGVVVRSGASRLREAMGRVYPHDVEGILAAYAAALQRVFLISVVLACLSVFGSAFCEWKSVKKDKKDSASQVKGEEDKAEKK